MMSYGGRERDRGERKAPIERPQLMTRASGEREGARGRGNTRSVRAWAPAPLSAGRLKGLGAVRRESSSADGGGKPRVGLDLLATTDDARAAEHLEVGLVDVVERAGDLGVEVGAADEVVERADRRPAPHLVIERALGDAVVRPRRREAEVPAEDERHLELRVLLGARDLLGVLELLERELHRLRPDLRHRLAEDLLLEARLQIGRDRLDRRVLDEEVVQ